MVSPEDVSVAQARATGNGNKERENFFHKKFPDTPKICRQISL
jgi:hypothetical protein